MLEYGIATTILCFKWVIEVTDWATLFDNVFQEAKRRFVAIYPFQNDSEVSPRILALRELIEKLPCSIDIVEFKIDAAKHRQLIKYDFSRLGIGSVKYHGSIDANDSGRIEDVLKDLNVNEEDAMRLSEDISQGLKITGFFGPDEEDVYFQFPLYDIRDNLNRFIGDFLGLFLVPFLPYSIIQKFEKPETDFNVLYNLEEDAILPFSKVVEKDEIFKGFLRLENRKPRPITIEDLQRDVSDIQLIPDVPDSVKRVFKCAKDLYIFGYFRYYFFTVSMHYAFLALESAIKNRYAKSLGDKAVLTNKRGQVLEMKRPAYRHIVDFCFRNKGWNIWDVKVNDQDFPYSMPKLLDWLLNNKIIKKWEKELLDAGIHLRHSLSHLETTSITSPDSQILQRVAQDINKLYSDKVT